MALYVKVNRTDVHVVFTSAQEETKELRKISSGRGANNRKSVNDRRGKMEVWQNFVFNGRCTLLLQPSPKV